MKTKEYVRISVLRQGTAREFDDDPAELWLDQNIEPETLLERDPLDITARVIDLAEQPELADPNLACLPNRGSSVKGEELWLKKLRAQNSDKETRRQFIQMFNGSK